MKHKIITNQSILTRPSEEINALEYEELFLHLEDTIKEIENAVGLAAVQIGILKRAFVVRYNGRLWRFANSLLVSRESPKKDIEGCLSIPGLQFEVRRATKIKLKDDINGEQEYQDMLARIIQHEHDHTLGKTLIQTGKIVSKE